MFTLIHYKHTAVKGHYKATCRCTSENKWQAYTDGREIYDNTTDPEYAGFVIKDSEGKTVFRMIKKKGSYEDV